MPPENNKFINNLYHEFEQKLFKVFGFGIEDLKKILDRAETDEGRGHCLETNFKAAFENGGAPHYLSIFFEELFRADSVKANHLIEKLRVYKSQLHHCLYLLLEHAPMHALLSFGQMFS